jgi:glutamine cyclotransferase
MRVAGAGFLPGVAILSLITCGAADPLAGNDQRKGAAPRFGYTVVRSYPHDRGAFTQGLLFKDGFLYEGTGQEGASSIRKVRLDTGEVVQIRRLDDRYFGEGISIVDDRLIQLTWKSEIGFLYDAKTFEPTGTFNYEGEGWGLAYDGKRLVRSDGSPVLRFLDPRTLRETGRVTVRDRGVPVEELNELEFVKGDIFANIFMTDLIARISPASGEVTGWIDLTGILPPRERAGVDVLNGIAYDAAGDRLFVTGKWWPKVFEIKLIPHR